MKAWGWLTLASLSGFCCVEPAHQRCIQSGHCREAQEIDSGIDAGPDIVTGLVAHWKLDETAPGKVEDSSGFGNHGRTEGVVRFVPGKIGNAIDLDGRGGVLINSTSQISDLQSMSFAAWLKIRDFPRAVNPGMAQPRIVDKISFYVAICVDPSCDQTLVYGGISMNRNVIWKPPNGILPSPDAGDLSEHWRHFAVIHDRRRAENEPQFFLDGVLTRTERVEVVDGGLFRSDQGDPLTIGYRLNAARWLNGQLDDVRLYNRLLSANEVEALFHLAP